MNFTLQTIVNLLLRYRYEFLLPIAIIEGPIISVIAGLLVSIGKMNFWIAYAVLILGDLIGDGLIYALGRWGSHTLVPKLGKYFGLTKKRIEWAENKFKDHAVKIQLFGKWSHAFGFVILVYSGMVKQKFGKFLLVNFVGTIPKSLFFLLIGFYFGVAYQQIDKYLNYAVYIIVAVVAIAAIAYVAITKFANKNLE